MQSTATLLQCFVLKGNPPMSLFFRDGGEITCFPLIFVVKIILLGRTVLYKRSSQHDCKHHCN